MLLGKIYSVNRDNFEKTSHNSVLTNQGQGTLRKNEIISKKICFFF